MIALEETTKSAGRNFSTNAVAEHGAGNALRIEQSLAYMAAHLNRPLQVATLAARANMSASHFFASFKRHTGCAPIDYFTRLRMRRASCLLGATSLSVKEVAAVLGYDDQFYFSRVFKSVNQVAPREYRVAASEMGGTETNSAAMPSKNKTLPSPPARTGLLESNGWCNARLPEKHGNTYSKRACLT